MTSTTPDIDPVSFQTPRSVVQGRYSLELVRTTCLLVLTIVAAGAVLWWLRPVLVPFLVGLTLFYLLAPVSGWVTRKFGVSEGVGAFGAGVIGLVVVALIGFLVWACVAQVTRDADTYATRVVELSNDPTFARVIQFVGLDREPDSGKVIFLTPEQTRQLVRTTAGWLQVLVADTFLVLVFLLFMLWGNSSATTPKSDGWPDQVAGRVRVYLVEMFVFSLIIGVFVGGILWLLGVKFWLSFGFLAFVLNFIPTIGPIIVAFLPVPVILLDPELDPWAKGLALTLPPIVHGFIANVIQPRFQSRSQGVHPVVSMIALIVFGMLWGPVGAVLAVPLAAVLKIAFERIPGGRVFADLLAGKLEGSSNPVAGTAKENKQ
jgi:AI-2 transport protein TqsA